MVEQNESIILARVHHLLSLYTRAQTFLVRCIIIGTIRAFGFNIKWKCIQQSSTTTANTNNTGLRGETNEYMPSADLVTSSPNEIATNGALLRQQAMSLPVVKRWNEWLVYCQCNEADFYTKKDFICAYPYFYESPNYQRCKMLPFISEELKLCKETTNENLTNFMLHYERHLLSNADDLNTLPSLSSSSPTQSDPKFVFFNIDDTLLQSLTTLLDTSRGGWFTDFVAMTNGTRAAATTIRSMIGEQKQKNEVKSTTGGNGNNRTHNMLLRTLKDLTSGASLRQLDDQINEWKLLKCKPQIHCFILNLAAAFSVAEPMISADAFSGIRRANHNVPQALYFLGTECSIDTSKAIDFLHPTG
jgi:hypothetical protein